MKRLNRVSDDEVRDAVASASSLTDALRRLDLRAAGANHASLRARIERLGLSTAHFDPEAARRRGLRHPERPLSEILVERSTYHRTQLKRRLYDSGLKPRACELCGQGEMWQGRRMSLILDHVNGVHDDNRLENLRIVCPTCNATLDTHCGRNARLPVEERRCRRCGRGFVPAGRQQYCSRACGQRGDGAARGPRPATRKADRPPEAQLRAEVAALGYSAVGRRYGVSDNAIRKWLRAYERGREAADGGVTASSA